MSVILKYLDYKTYAIRTCNKELEECIDKVVLSINNLDKYTSSRIGKKGTAQAHNDILIQMRNCLNSSFRREWLNIILQLYNDSKHPVHRPHIPIDGIYIYAVVDEVRRLTEVSESIVEGLRFSRHIPL